MLLIEERKPKKVTGETSFFLKFDYNTQIIDIIKQLTVFNYDKTTKEWEIPITYLSKLLDRVCSYTDIELHLLREKPEKQASSISNISFSEYRYKPFNYQVEGIEYGLTHDKWLLLFDMGLGKTLTAIYLANELKKQGKVKHCLIICGVNSLKNNWRKEIHKFTDLSCTILGEKVRRTGTRYVGSIKERAEQLNHPIDEFFVITNIETLRSKSVTDAILKGPNDFDMIVIDEIHRLGDPSSDQTTGVLKLTKAPYRIGMTGTLITNNPLNAYAPLKWIGLEKGTFTNFKKFYCNFGGPFHNIITGYKNLDLLQGIIDHHSLRKTKDDEDVELDLPLKTIINEYVDMEPDQATFYENIKSGIRDQVDKVQLNTKDILALSARLRQATACPSILTTENISSAKIKRAVELTQELISKGEKVIIFSTFKETVSKLAQVLSDFNPLVCTGDIKDDVISTNIDIFQEDKNRKLLIATHQKMGTGFTLTASRYLIFMDIPYTNAAYVQAQDRIYRIGTEKPVFIYHLITSDTIDERVLEIVEDKEALSNFLIDGEVTDRSLTKLRKYITEEI